MMLLHSVSVEFTPLALPIMRQIPCQVAAHETDRKDAWSRFFSISVAITSIIVWTFYYNWEFLCVFFFVALFLLKALLTHKETAVGQFYKPEMLHQTVHFHDVRVCRHVFLTCVSVIISGACGAKHSAAIPQSDLNKLVEYKTGN